MAQIMYVKMEKSNYIHPAFCFYVQGIDSLLVTYVSVHLMVNFLHSRYVVIQYFVSSNDNATHISRLKDYKANPESVWSAQHKHANLALSASCYE